MKGACEKMRDELEMVISPQESSDEDSESNETNTSKKDNESNEDSVQPPKKIQKVTEEAYAVSSYGVPDITYWLNSSFETLVGEGQKKKSARSAIESSPCLSSE